MKKRNFLKSLLLLLSSIPLKLYSNQNQDNPSFDYGVASGDPTNSHVILWTKISKSNKSNIDVKWEVSTENDFTEILASGTKTSIHSDNFTVKVDVNIPKKYNGKKIYYRFYYDDIFSDIGITSTLPLDDPDIYNIAFCSCSNYPAGFFNSYKEIARNADIDLVLHLGDYIYEYGANVYPSEGSEEMGRAVDPPHEIVTLEDYRRRYALYRSDVDLQELHSSKPMIVIWDDHEFTNNTWKNGAENHSNDEGIFEERIQNAIKAYYEWMPIREKKYKSSIWRDFKVGNLFQLLMLDTRYFYRDKQVDINTFIDNGIIDKERYKESLNQERSLLGADQHSWIEQTVSNKFKWSLFGQQLLIGPKYLPALFRDFNRNELPNYLKNIIDIAGAKLPYNTDQWDGYPKARAKFYENIKASQSSIILAGDSHDSWLSNLYNNQNKFIGIEIGAPSITSPNSVDTFGKNIDKIEEAFRSENKDLAWIDGKNKGYVELAISNKDIKVSYHYVSTVKSSNYQSLKPMTFVINNNQPIKI
tara:strand:+ start:594 stop:2183 length:1590 start_codon:yes stop_codon:yes gene_type:complete